MQFRERKVQFCTKVALLEVKTETCKQRYYNLIKAYAVPYIFSPLVPGLEIKLKYTGDTWKRCMCVT